MSATCISLTQEQIEPSSCRSDAGCHRLCLVEHSPDLIRQNSTYEPAEMGSHTIKHMTGEALRSCFRPFLSWTSCLWRRLVPSSEAPRGALHKGGTLRFHYWSNPTKIDHHCASQAGASSFVYRNACRYGSIGRGRLELRPSAHLHHPGCEPTSSMLWKDYQYACRTGPGASCWSSA